MDEVIETETETEMPETQPAPTDSRLDRQEQIKKFRRLRERIEACMMAARKALKTDDLDMAGDKLKEPAEKIDELLASQDKDNPIQVRSVLRVSDDLKRLLRKVEGLKNKKAKGRKSGGSKGKSGGGIPIEELDWIQNALYLINRDHQDVFRDLHVKKCQAWAKRFEKQGYAEEKPMVTINNYIKKYKVAYLFDRDAVQRRINLSKGGPDTASSPPPSAERASSADDDDDDDQGDDD